MSRGQIGEEAKLSKDTPLPKTQELKNFVESFVTSRKDLPCQSSTLTIFNHFVSKWYRDTFYELPEDMKKDVRNVCGLCFITPHTCITLMEYPDTNTGISSYELHLPRSMLCAQSHATLSMLPQRISSSYSIDFLSMTGMITRMRDCVFKLQVPSRFLLDLEPELALLLNQARIQVPMNVSITK